MTPDPVALRAPLELLAELKCSDGYCDLGGPAKGMHTNGGCHCLDAFRNPSLRARLRTVLRVAREVANAD